MGTHMKSALVFLSAALAAPSPYIVTVYEPQPDVVVVTTTITLGSSPTAPSVTTVSPDTPFASGTNYAALANSTDFQTSILNSHNLFRSYVDYPAMAWSDTLASFAQNSANTCVMQHTADNSYGENIYMTTAPSTTGWDAAYAWYAEVDSYNQMFAGQSTGDFSEETGHYTQLIWKSSIELGCAVSQCSSGTYVFCEYSPPGNVGGEYGSNVPAPGTMYA